jgi:hypothetical protein
MNKLKDVKEKKEIDEKRVLNKSKDPDLILKVCNELSKDHIYDDKEKLAVFLSALTGYLNPPSTRMTTNLLGNSSVGKDNLSKAVAKLFPAEDVLDLTRATKSTLEDDIDKYRIITFSELNTKTDKGANVDIVEPLKQLTEGGISVLKKDMTKGNKSVIHKRQEQKAVIWASTETSKDAELETRGTCITILGHPAKHKAVNDATLDQYSNSDNLLKEVTKKESWVTNLIRIFRDRDVLVYNPYLTFVKGIFDETDPRSQRDIKRFRSCVLAYGWLHQEQRKIITKNGKRIVEGNPIDIIRVIEILGSFLNQTYAGFDSRINSVLDILTDKGELSRKQIQDELGIKSVNTIKEYIKVLSDRNLVEYVYEKELNNEKKETGESMLKRINNSPILRSLSTTYQKPIINISPEEVKIYISNVLLQHNRQANDRLLIDINNLKPLNLKELGDIKTYYREPVNVLGNVPCELVYDEK